MVLSRLKVIIVVVVIALLVVVVMVLGAIGLQAGDPQPGPVSTGATPETTTP